MNNYIYNRILYMSKRDCYYSDDETVSVSSSCEKKHYYYCCEKPKKCDVCGSPKKSKSEQSSNKEVSCKETTCKDKKKDQCIVISITPTGKKNKTNSF
jgi:hypothetical protein